MAPVMVFLISSPLISPSAFLITLGSLGTGIALGKLGAAIVLSLAGWWLTDKLCRQGYLDESAVRFRPVTTLDIKQKPCSKDACNPSDQPMFRVDHNTIKIFLAQAKRFSIFLGKLIIPAVLAQALVMRYVPQDWIIATVGAKRAYGVLLATVVGIPAYINSISAVPLLKGLMSLGMDKGAVLAFIIAGPVMTVPSMVAVMSLFKWRPLLVYVLVGFLGSLAFGYAYQLY